MTELEFARAMLAALQTAMLAHVKGRPMRKSYAINNRSIEYSDNADVIRGYQFWQAEVKRAEAVEAVSAGLPNPRRSYVRFSRS